MYVGRPLLILLVFDVAVILGFRNNSCYLRWWEARTLWGAVINNSRSWARQVTTVMRPDTPAEVMELKTMQQQLVYHQIAFAHALRQHLRRLAPWEELRPLLGETALNELRDQQNVPLAIQQQMGLMLRECQIRGWVDLTQWLALDGTLDDLADAQGGTERIKNTPMPKQYDYFPP